MVRSELHVPCYRKTTHPPNTLLKNRPVPDTLHERQQAHFRKALSNLRKCENLYSKEIVP
jgi:hypothetical protein